MVDHLQDATDPCPFTPAIELLLGRWTSHVLWALLNRGPLRFGEIQDMVPEAKPKVLTERLRRLERDGFLRRSRQGGFPPRVDYEATELAASLVPVFQHLEQWACEHMVSVDEARRSYDQGERPEYRFDAADAARHGGARTAELSRARE